VGYAICLGAPSVLHQGSGLDRLESDGGFGTAKATDSSAANGNLGTTAAQRGPAAKARRFAGHGRSYIRGQIQAKLPSKTHLGPFHSQLSTMVAHGRPGARVGQCQETQQDAIRRLKADNTMAPLFTAILVTEMAAHRRRRKPSRYPLANIPLESIVHGITARWESRVFLPCSRVRTWIERDGYDP
jgi:hypothetical protein